MARPWRLVMFLAFVPITARTVARRRWAALLAGAAASMLVAECGRRRACGARVFPPSASLFAPVWLLERSLCSWVALAARLRGGVRYAGERLPVAATSRRVLRRRVAARTGQTAPEAARG
jgi:hypothetical protein